MQLNLNESDKKYLITEIQNKYLSKQDDFKNIFLINKTIFGNNFYIQLENEYNNFETRIIYLVDELIDTEKLNKFLEIIRDKYPSFANQIKIPQLELIQILNDGFEANREILLTAYQLLAMRKRKIKIEANESLKNATELINRLATIPQGEQTYTCLEKFVGYLLEGELDLSLSLKTSLQEWADNNVNKYEILVELLDQEEQKRRDESNPCLLVAITSKCVDEYVVDAWLIKNLDQYDQGSVSGCDQLITQLNTDKKLTGVEEIVRKLILKCIDTTQKNPQEIHIFLPNELINYPIDRWQEEENGYTIGGMYNVMIRCSNRLGIRNPTIVRWKEKKDFLNKQLHKLANEIFISGDSQIEKELEKEFIKKKAVAVKIITTFSKEQPGELLFNSFVPCALWIREKRDDINNQAELDQLLNDICLQELPDRVKDKRFDAMYEDFPDNHVGSHLCLLWDDPNLLPPTQGLTHSKF